MGVGRGACSRRGHGLTTFNRQQHSHKLLIMEHMHNTFACLLIDAARNVAVFWHISSEVLHYIFKLAIGDKPTSDLGFT